MLCKICGESNELEFYSSNKTKCKNCIKKAVSEYREANIDKIREYDRNRPNYIERVKKCNILAKHKRESSPDWKPKRNKTEEDIKKYKAEYYQTNKVRLDIKNKEWAKSNSIKRKEIANNWNKRNRGICSKNIKAWKSKNKDKVKAHDKIKYAIKKGNLKAPKYCEHCGLIEKLQAHHSDYSKPLDVIWLCVLCHNKEHIRLNEI